MVNGDNLKTVYLAAAQVPIYCSSSELTGTEASLKVPDFTISVYSSSCHYLFFDLVLAPLLSDFSAF